MENFFFCANYPKLCEAALPQNFQAKELSEILVYYRKIKIIENPFTMFTTDSL